MLEYAFLLLFPALMAYAATSDLMTMTIPNRISLLLLGGFLLAAPFAGLDWQAFGMHLAAGALMLAVGIVLFALRVVGGGDAKLIAAVALWLGFEHLLPFLIVMAFVGGGLAILLLAYRRFVPADLAALSKWSERLYSPRTGIPYGVAIAAAGLWVYPKTPVFSAFLA